MKYKHFKQALLFKVGSILKFMKEKRYPVGWHPANEEEAMARIEAIEAEYERTGKATDFEEFIEELKAEGLWLIQ